MEFPPRRGRPRRGGLAIKRGVFQGLPPLATYVEPSGLKTSRLHLAPDSAACFV